MNDKKYQKKKIDLLALQWEQLLLWEDLKKIGPPIRGSVSTLKIPCGYLKKGGTHREKRGYVYFAYNNEKGKRKLISIWVYEPVAKQMVDNYKDIMTIVVKMTEITLKILKIAKSLEKSGEKINRKQLGQYYRPNRPILPSEKSLFQNADIPDINKLTKQLKRLSRTHNSELREWASKYLKEIVEEKKITN